MQNILRNTPAAEQPYVVWILFATLIGYVIAGLFLFSLLGYGVAVPFFGFDYDLMMKTLQNPYGSSDAKVPLLIFQGFSSLGAFVVAPVFFLRKHLKLHPLELVTTPAPAFQPAVITIIAVLSCMVVNSAFIEWNQQMELPEFLSGFEQWAAQKEKQMEELTLYLTEFDNLSQYLIAIVVIAILPAIGEELLFRGIIQNIFQSTTKNPHLAIWVTAFLFSAFHLQFYGLIPRMMLGVLFGYLYWWSGYLSLAMLGHFVNNAFSVTVFYLSHHEIIEMSPEDMDKTPPFYIILVFLLAGSAMLYLFHKYFSLRETHE
ncbi:CPBP family intramembrane glutamic endopeptidase [Marinoscillum sp. MHG1-6]|uniref:CPBP family intramembrane glutamic endopeptidase n=1 Tax=Marinoscillum sp. MHG1-6 TaxID=2959627 RepID=UPI00215802FF|nr:CPBP family intramembrane glutamic endopeptidase [Marinoscillum sp. MHG1-6]